ncbi:MAG TPA: hypothetical protein VLJ37_03775 [bacterium]|nr:hypothetical protein [bacterium]
MTLNELIIKHPQLKFLKHSPKIQSLSPEKQAFLAEMIEDAMFWVDLEKKPNSGDGFKFLAASYGLENAQEEANSKGLEGKEREKFLRPHQDLFTMFNPYSGNGRETQKAPGSK